MGLIPANLIPNGIITDKWLVFFSANIISLRLMN